MSATLASLHTVSWSVFCRALNPHAAKPEPCGSSSLVPVNGAGCVPETSLTSTDFEALLIEFLPVLKRYALYMCRNIQHAEDILQTTVMKALRSQHQFRVGTNFKAWMNFILRNEHVNLLRRDKRKQTADIDTAPEQFLAEDSRQDAQLYLKEVLECVALLTVPQREVIQFVCLQGLSYEETANLMGTTVGTVKSRLWRARGRVKVLIDQERHADGERTDQISGYRNGKPLAVHD